MEPFWSGFLVGSLTVIGGLVAIFLSLLFIVCVIDTLDGVPMPQNQGGGDDDQAV